MFQEEVLTVAQAAVKKVGLLKSRPAAYFVASMLAGIYVGLGILLIFTAGGLLSAAESPWTRIIMGASFGIALSLVVAAGAELFTGNNMVMTIGLFNKKVAMPDVIKLWIVCWLGNLAGSLIVAVLYMMTGHATGPVGEFIAKSALAKSTIPFLPMLVRAILCNILVCLAVWCGMKMKSESGKLIMIFWCLFAFITTGFEHSVANMTLIAIGAMNPMGFDVTWAGYAYNLIVVTLGNMIGGILFIGLPYAYIAGKLKED